MSVPVGERNEGDKQYLNLAKMLAKHTMTLCRNEKIFPKSQRWLLSKRIVDTSLDILMSVREADEAQKYPEGRDESRKLYIASLCSLQSLHTLVDLAYDVLGIDDDRIEYWTGLIKQTIESIPI